MSGASATKESGRAADSHQHPGSGPAQSAARRSLFDLANVNLSARLVSRRDLEHWNPHRGGMAMLDWIVWHSADFTRGVGLKIVRSDEFWVEGHFPAKAMFPGVLMLETGAQLGSFLYNSRFTRPKLPVFTRIEDASFRAAVVPGDELFVLCKDVKFGDKRFISDIQGLVNGRVAFEARITGMSGNQPAAE